MDEPVFCCYWFLTVSFLKVVIYFVLIISSLIICNHLIRTNLWFCDEI